jgi:hypothetical protein
MAPRPRDTQTLELFEWQPPQVVERFEARAVRAHSLRTQIAKAVGETLKADERTREEIAQAMSAAAGEEISLHMLNAYASEAREDHTIPYARLLALVEVTGDHRLLQLGADRVGHSVVDNKWLAWIDVGQLAERRDEVQKALDVARSNAKRATR